MTRLFNFEKHFKKCACCNNAWVSQLETRTECMKCVNKKELEAYVDDDALYLDGESEVYKNVG